MGWPQKLRWGIATMAFLQTSWADTEKIIAPEGSDTLNDVSYNKHDPKRPQPLKVKGQYQHLSAPSDAILLFDGKNLDAFQNSLASSKKSNITKEGALVLGPGGLISNKSFSDCQVHVEWKIPKGNTIQGQKGSDSGILMMGLFEIQILESYNNLTYADGLAGAMYGERPPLVNASLPQGDWQSFDIYFKTPKYENKKMVEPAKLTLVHNGILVHLEQSFLNLSNYRKHKPYPNYPLKDGPVQLKWDGDPVEFRNIWVRPLKPYDQPKTKKPEVKKSKEKKEKAAPSK
jgi:hypothetical protein